MTTKLELILLGESTIKLNDKPVTELPSRKAEAMLIYLVCTQRPYSRELLADFFWDDRASEQALANLRSLLSGLRHSFKPFLDISRQTVAFKESSSHWIDAVAFQQLAQSEAVADWETAVANSSQSQPGVPVLRRDRPGNPAEGYGAANGRFRARAEGDRYPGRRPHGPIQRHRCFPGR